MNPNPLSTLVCSALMSCSGDPSPPPHDTPTDGPELAVGTYFEASDQASSRLLRAAFHPAAQLLSVDDAGAARLVTQLDWWRRLDAVTSPTPATDRQLTVLDREGPLALIEAVSTWPTHTFDDLMLVVRTPDGWRIVGKAFEKLAPGAPAGAALGATADPAEDAAIRAVLADKLAAHAEYDPALLARSHTPHCLYAAIGVDTPFTLSTLSEAAARYARRREAGEHGRSSRWQILRIDIRGRIAAVKLDVIYRGRRYIDHLLLLHLSDGWRIAAASWGDPAWRAE